MNLESIPGELRARRACVRRGFVGFLLVSMILILGTAGLTAGSDESVGTAGMMPGESDGGHGPWVEAHNTGWAFHLDNDAFTTINNDQDYTGGFAFILSGRRATECFFSLDGLLGGLNRITGVGRLYDHPGGFELHSIEFGLMAFTPEDMSTSGPIYDDHPYASLLFMANTQQRVVPNHAVSCRTALTFGILGTRVAEGTQRVIHEALDQQLPQGWCNQISDGGEPTGKYTILLQWALAQSRRDRPAHYELKTSAEANAGYTTDAALALSGRFGRISTPWWSFNPHQAEYISPGPLVSKEPAGGSSRELFLWVGGSVRYRIYNALLQGQFRHSEVSFSRSELNSVIGEAWVGLTGSLYRELRLSVFVRARSRELEVARRDPLWGGFILSFGQRPSADSID